MTAEREAMTLERQAFEDAWSQRSDAFGATDKEAAYRWWRAGRNANLSRAAEPVAFRWLMPMGRGFVWTRWFDAGDNTPPEHCRIEYAYTHPNEDARPLSISAITAACDAYVESAVEHGWDREQVESIMRNDDMRAAIDAAMAEDSRDGD